ncbi:HD domain-containing protein [Methanobacterium sp.]|uniref:HD domain-containing protein n=1 Tax=Methanobacterium sp. TaxID=2164 RepID=UPI003D646396
MNKFGGGVILKLIRDSVHGNLDVDEFEIKLADTPQIQRLRRIKQLGFTSLVYPGANHSRFEHSIGTMHIASQIADNVGLDDYDKKMIRACALLHDTGHGPFSHVSEGVLETPHEYLTSHVIKESQLSDILSEMFDPQEIIKIINGKGPLGQIMSGELDADRMDYLVRDSYYTGVAYGMIDVERLINSMKLEENLIIELKGLQAAESALIARYLMYPSVYQHHTTRIINSMFRRCMKWLFDTQTIDPKKIYNYDDADIVSIARSQKGRVKDIIQRLDNRDLFKRVFSVKLSDLEEPKDVFKIKESKLKKIELEIAEDLGSPADYTIIDIPEYPFFNEMRTLVSVGDEHVKLSEISSLVNALKNVRFNYADICIYVPDEYAQKSSNFPFENYIELTMQKNIKDWL